MRKLLILFLLLCSTVTVDAQCWKSISACDGSSCALKVDGTLWIWGANTTGQLGNGTYGSMKRNVPGQLGTDNDWKSISSGGGSFFAIKNSGTLWVWGNNTVGQLGDGTTIQKNTPVQVGTGTDWKTVSYCHNHAGAIKNDGTLWTWGWNNYGQLGDGTYINKHAPVQIGTATDWATISVGESFNMAIKTDGSLWAWGYNMNGELGDGTLINKITPIRIGTANDWKTISCGFWHTLALKTDGTLWTWGYNNHGQLGDGTLVDKNVPAQIGTSTDWVKINASNYCSSFAIKSDGGLWSWGRNAGNLSDGTIVNVLAPQHVSIFDTWQEVSSGHSHTLAIKKGGKLFSCGDNGFGTLGDGTFTHNTILTDNIGCPTISAITELANSKTALQIIPNPCSNFLSLRNETKQTINSIRLVDLSYRTIKLFSPNQNILDVQEVPSGLYFLIITAPEQNYSFKIYKQ